MARTNRNYHTLLNNLNARDLKGKSSSLPKFPKSLIKTKSIELKALEEIVKEGFKVNNRVLLRSKGIDKKGRKKFFNSSWEEVPRVLRQISK